MQVGEAHLIVGCLDGNGSGLDDGRNGSGGTSGGCLCLRLLLDLLLGLFLGLRVASALVRLSEQASKRTLTSSPALSSGLVFFSFLGLRAHPSVAFVQHGARRTR